MKNNSPRKIMSRLLDQAYLEVMPTGTILDRLVHIPRHCFVAITCSPTNGPEPTLELVEKLRANPDERRLELIPHIAARMVRDKEHLREILARLEAAQLIVPGFHLSSFNDVERTQKWRVRTCKRLFGEHNA